MATMLFDVPPTLATVSRHTVQYGGKVHGNDKNGAVDVEFPTMWEAASWTRTMMNSFGWEIEIRAGDAVTSIHSTVVLTVGPNYHPTTIDIND